MSDGLSDSKNLLLDKQFNHGTRLVNLRTYKGKGYVRIDRRSIFGNPYVIGKDGTREEVIEKYCVYFYERLAIDGWFREKVESLDGKILACWCVPEKCHGDVIIEYLEGRQRW